MKNLLTLFLSCLTTLCIFAQDTFSIVAVDPETGEVGSAGASCVPGIGDLGGVILLSGIIPGKGGVNAQAYICIDPHINLDNAIARMEEGLSPDEIISWLEANDACFSQNFDPAYRQYGIVAFDETGEPQAAAFTGENADDWKGHRVGDHYAIQGNILLGPQILDSMEARFLSTEGNLATRLMAAMQGANVPGADSRCLDAGTSSTSAFLRVFKPEDDPSDPYLELNVAEAPTGVEPIDSLQALFNELVVARPGPIPPSGYEFSVLPNPSSGEFVIEVIPQLPAELSIQVFTLNGRKLLEQPFGLIKQNINLSEPGVFILKIVKPDGRVFHTQKIVVVD